MSYIQRATNYSTSSRMVLCKCIFSVPNSKDCVFLIPNVTRSRSSVQSSNSKVSCVNVMEFPLWFGHGGPGVDQGWLSDGISAERG